MKFLFLKKKGEDIFPKTCLNTKNKPSCKSLFSLNIENHISKLDETNQKYNKRKVKIEMTGKPQTYLESEGT